MFLFIISICFMKRKHNVQWTNRKVHIDANRLLPFFVFFRKNYNIVSRSIFYVILFFVSLPRRIFFFSWNIKNLQIYVTCGLLYIIRYGQLSQTRPDDHIIICLWNFIFEHIFWKFYASGVQVNTYTHMSFRKTSTEVKNSHNFLFFLLECHVVE